MAEKLGKIGPPFEIMSLAPLIRYSINSRTNYYSIINGMSHVAGAAKAAHFARGPGAS
jgi:hypothetical protein